MFAGRSERPLATPSVCQTGGKPSTWFPPGGLVEQDPGIFTLSATILHSKVRLIAYVSFVEHFYSNFEKFQILTPKWPFFEKDNAERKN